MKRYENIAMSELMRQALAVCTKRKQASSVAWPFLEQLRTEASFLFNNDNLDDSGYFELLNKCSNAVEALKSSRAMPSIAESFMFFRDALMILPVFHRQNLNEIVRRLAFFLQESCEAFRQRVYKNERLPAAEQQLFDDIKVRIAKLIEESKGGRKPERNYVEILAERERLVEKHLLRGLIGSYARHYWQDLYNSDFDESALIANQYNAFSHRLQQITSSSGMPSVSAINPFEHHSTEKARFRSIEGTLGFLSDLALQIANTRGAKAPLCEGEIHIIESFVTGLQTAIFEISTLDCTPLYDACALVRARISAIT